MTFAWGSAPRSPPLALFAEAVKRLVLPFFFIRGAPPGNVGYDRYDHRIGESGNLRVAGTAGLDRTGVQDGRFVQDRIAGVRTELSQRLAESALFRFGTDLRMDAYQVVLGDADLTPSQQRAAANFPSRTDLGFGVRGELSGADREARAARIVGPGRRQRFARQLRKGPRDAREITPAASRSTTGASPAEGGPVSAPLRPLALTLTAAGLASACSAADPDMPDHHDYGDEPLGVTSAALSDDDPVSTAVKQSCTTASVKGLAVQLVKEIDCLRPNTMKKIAGISGVELGTAAAGVPFLQTPAADALVAAQKARGKTIHINSGLRTLPQQYLLYRWYKTGRCGIGLAASPGTSNHESGLAVDIEDNAGWRSAMQAHDFKWLGASDPVHYDFVGAGAVDLKGLSVKAFQRLWNRNHADDPINEDGSYGPQTEARLAKSPVGGFPKGATCEQLDAGVDAGDPEPEPSAPAETSDPPEDEPAPEAPTTARELPSGDSQGCAAAPRAGESDAGAAVRGTLFAGALVALAALRRRRERGSAGARDRT